MSESGVYNAAGVFRAANCITGRVECISSDNPINAELWPKTLAASTVLVMTAQAFLNMLEGGPATLQTFDLIVSIHTAGLLIASTCTSKSCQDASRSYGDGPQGVCKHAMHILKPQNAVSSS